MLNRENEREGMEIAVREKAEPFAPVIALLLLLVGAAVFGLYLGWALMAGAILFTLDAKRHGRTWEQVGNILDRRERLRSDIPQNVMYQQLSLFDDPRFSV